MIKKPEMILIDVDGTLVDSVPDLAYCIDEMMKALDMPTHGEIKVRDWIGNGIDRLIRRALIGQHDGEPDEALLEKAYPILRNLYAENTNKRSLLYPGVLEGLAYLKAESYKLGCVTNKDSRYALPLLESLGLDDYFEIILCGDTLEKKKPDPMQLLHAAEFFSVKAANAMMLGDSITDVIAARAAGFQIVCMSYGYNHGNDIREASPDVVIDSMAELADILDKAVAA